MNQSSLSVRLAALIIALTLVAPTVSSAEPDLLEPERVFRLSARFRDASTLELQYKIADGYYMYRQRFKFTIEQTAPVKLGSAQFSKGAMKQDPTFGWVETYRDSVRILIPVATSGKSEATTDRRPLRLKVTSQGCADAGVCYPPMHQQITLKSGSMDIVFPDAAGSVGALELRQQSTSKGAPSLSDTLLKKN